MEAVAGGAALLTVASFAWSVVEVDPRRSAVALALALAAAPWSAPGAEARPPALTAFSLVAALLAVYLLALLAGPVAAGRGPRRVVRAERGGGGQAASERRPLADPPLGGRGEAIVVAAAGALGAMVGQASGLVPAAPFEGGAAAALLVGGLDLLAVGGDRLRVGSGALAALAGAGLLVTALGGTTTAALEVASGALGVAIAGAVVLLPERAVADPPR